MIATIKVATCRAKENVFQTLLPATLTFGQPRRNKRVKNNASLQLSPVAREVYLFSPFGATTSGFHDAFYHQYPTVPVDPQRSGVLCCQTMACLSTQKTKRFKRDSPGV